MAEDAGIILWAEVDRVLVALEPRSSLDGLKTSVQNLELTHQPGYTAEKEKQAG